MIAIGGAFGTLSEIALALKTDTPVIRLKTWDIEGIERVESPEQAVDRARQRAAVRPAPDPSHTT